MWKIELKKLKEITLCTPKNLYNFDFFSGMYNGSMMSSVGYSQVSDHANTMGLPNMAAGMPGAMPNFPPRGQQMGGQPLPGMAVMTALPPPPSQQQQQLENFNPGNTDTVIFKPEGRGASHIAGKNFEWFWKIRKNSWYINKIE